MSIRSFYCLVVRSYFVQIARAYDSTSFLLKLKIMTGSSPRYMIVFIILDKSEPWLKFFFLRSKPTGPPSPNV